MIIAYPNVPLPLVKSYKAKDKYLANHDRTGSGLPVYGLNTQHGYSVLSVSWLLTDDEMAILNAWFVTDLIHGSKLFSINLKMGGGLRAFQCYFSKPFKSRLNGKKWQVQASLIGVDKPFDTLAEYNIAKQALINI